MHTFSKRRTNFFRTSETVPPPPPPPAKQNRKHLVFQKCIICTFLLYLSHGWDLMRDMSSRQVSCFVFLCSSQTFEAVMEMLTRPNFTKQNIHKQMFIFMSSLWHVENTSLRLLCFSTIIFKGEHKLCFLFLSHGPENGRMFFFFFF